MLNIILRDVIEQPTTLTNHEHQTTTRMVITLMNLKMLSKLGNALGEDGNLNIGGTRVSRMCRVLFNDLLFFSAASISVGPFLSVARRPRRSYCRRLFQGRGRPDGNWERISTLPMRCES
ncbi:hypothetical protein JCM18909_1210 [Cutibacterium acnes JCM 18909]|nr:hypothetical protein JCM18909_1210 [Cutibacterium acnes JCM 18909]